MCKCVTLVKNAHQIHCHYNPEWTNKQPRQPLQCLQISKRKRRKRDRERKSERQEKAVVITLPCLSFFTHSGVERKLCVAGAGENTKQALLCERWIGCGSQRVYLCCWTITLGHTLHLWQNEGEEREKLREFTSISQLLFWWFHGGDTTQSNRRVA